MKAIGIDLGTTNSLISVFEENGPRLIKNPLGKVLTPSAISIGSDGQIITGEAARERLITHPEVSVASFKRFMGANRETKLGKKSFRPQELSSFILRALKADAEADLNETIEQAIISVPAYFNDQQRQATIEAGQLAGLEVQRLVNEPTAAALAYGLSEKKEGNFLIFDLGGGTFDISILDKYDDIMEIKATTGDTRLGGDDFTDAITQILAKRHDINMDKLTLQEKAQVLSLAEQLKCKLTKEQELPYQLSLSAKTQSGNITRSEFELACASLLQRLRLPTERAVRDSKIQAKDFDAIVMVGGATRMPMVRSLVARMFGKLPMINIDPDTTVALGACVQAGLIQRNSALKDIIMTDVCPYTLGVATVDDSDDPTGKLSISAIIERNAVIPISRTITLNTVQKNQKQLNVEVYQGENLRPENNIHLGTIEVGVPRNQKGAETVDITFTYDLNGALQVEVLVNSTKRKYQEIFGNTANLSKQELEKRFEVLQSIKLHPRDKVENQTLIAKAERVYEDANTEQREWIKASISDFEREIGNQQLRNPDQVRASFAEQIDAIEKQIDRLDH